MRRRRSVKRDIKPDAVFNDINVAKFINCLMLQGKKVVAERVFYASIDALKSDGDNPLQEFYQALNNIKPTVEVRSRRVGGATYQVPMDVSEDRGMILAMRWLIAAARKRTGQSMDKCLLAEFRDAVSGTGSAMKKREDTHKMAKSNRAFSHYRW